MRSFVLFLPIAATLVVGCATSRPEPQDCIAATPTIHSPAAAGLPSDRIARALGTQPPGVDRAGLLALSGGGQWGAFGAGFLYRWYETNDYRTFRVVTGISTGALISTFAFIGDREALTLYRKVDSDDVYRMRWPLAWAFSNSLATTKPLRRMLEKVVTPAVLEAVVAEAELGRELMVGVVNLDTGQFETVLLTELARTGDVSRYIDVLMASAAIPVAFPPVFIDCYMYVDGGTRFQMFYSIVEAGLKASRVPRPATSGVRRQPLAYGLVNGQLTMAEATTKNALTGIGGRSLTALLNQSALHDRHALMRLEQSGFDVRFVTADGVDCNDDGSGGAFNNAFMNCLFDAGIAMADARGWKTTASDL